MKIELKIDRLTAELTEANLTIVELKAALGELLVFAMDDYYESCATAEFKSALKRARKALKIES